MLTQFISFSKDSDIDEIDTYRIHYDKVYDNEVVSYLNSHKDRYVYECIFTDQPVKIYFNIHAKKGHIHGDNRLECYLKEILNTLKQVSNIDQNYSYNNVKIAISDIDINGHFHIVFDNAISNSRELSLFAFYINKVVDPKFDYFVDTSVYRCDDKYDDPESKRRRYLLPVGFEDVFNGGEVFYNMDLKDSIVGIFDMENSQEIEFKDIIWSRDIINAYVERDKYKEKCKELEKCQNEYEQKCEELEDYKEKCQNEYEQKCEECENYKQKYLSAKRYESLYNIYYNKFSEIESKYNSALREIEQLRSQNTRDGGCTIV